MDIKFFRFLTRELIKSKSKIKIRTERYCYDKSNDCIMLNQ